MPTLSYPHGVFPTQWVLLIFNHYPMGLGCLKGVTTVTEKGGRDSGILIFLCCFKKSYFFGLPRGGTFVTPRPLDPLILTHWVPKPLILTQWVPKQGVFSQLNPDPLGFHYPQGHCSLVTLSHPRLIDPMGQ